MLRLAPPLAALAALSACSGYEEGEEPVEAVSQSEAEALDDAAEIIEQRRLPEDVLPPEGDDGAGEPGADTGQILPAPRESGGPARMEFPDE
ncbi:MAG: hypothetical protein JJ901_10985 [Erythrobacter sp.]|uniref:hypothetical protein n=1 Tax=Erythrobacter sp. TaxID=1042 RepID=UPI001B14F8ED|nr:hypothetical protein [Erythrobacter sp.]MBO6768807.1 hypothetical protein [Erythrobacter sp.]